MSAYKNYKGLIQAVKGYLNREDPDVVSRIPEWIHSAEDMLDRRLRHSDTITTIQYTLKSGDKYIPAPEDLIELKTIRIEDTEQMLMRRSIELLGNIPYAGDDPMAFAPEGDRFRLNKPANRDMIVTLIYYAAEPKLTNADDTNKYLIYCGDIMLHYALAEGFSYLANPQESAEYLQKATFELQMLEDQINRERFAGSTIINFGDEEALDYYF